VTAAGDASAGPGAARQLLFLGVLAVLVLALDHGELWTSRWQADEDSRQHVFWAYRYRDAEVLVDDYFADFFSAMAPWGYRGLFLVTAPVVDPLALSKGLALTLMAITVLFTWRLGQRLEPRAGGLVAGVLVLWTASEFRGGLPRTFAWPLMAVHLDALLARRYGAASLVLVAEALFYPQQLLVGAGIQGMTLLRELVAQPGPLPARLAGAGRGLALSAAGLVLAGVAIAGPYLAGRPVAMGPVITAAEARQRPEFQEGGRVEFFRDDTLAYWVTSGRSGIGWSDGQTLRVLLIAAGALLLGRRLLRGPALALDTALVGLGLFGLAHAVLFRLHLPNRYTRTTLAFAGIMLLAAHGPAAWRELGRRVPALARGGAGLAARRGAVAATALALVAIAAAARLTGDPRRVRPESVDMFRFAGTLPKQAMLAGNTGLAWIPLLTQRRVFVDGEFALPYLKTYYAEVGRRARALGRALDASDAAEANRFCRDTGVTHLVFRKGTAVPLPPAARGRPPSERVFENDRFLVVTCPRGASA
jgi:hypothetical protein